MSDKQPMVIVKDVSKTFQLPHERHSGLKQAAINLFNKNNGVEKQKVLNDVSFEIQEGEFFGIVGRNGSGKSTLLKLLAGIYTPDKGLIQINGALTPFIELGVGFNPELTGRENVFLNGALLGFSRDDMEGMYEEIVTFAEIEKFMDQKLKNYSSGMQVRLAFSIAIRANTPVLLIDEVLAVGDTEFQRKCYAEFRKLKENGRTIIFVTHDMSAVERFCDRVLVLSKGKALGVYNPSEASVIYERMNVPESTKSKENENRWGTNKVTITSVDIYDKDLDKKTPVNAVVQSHDVDIKIRLNDNGTERPIIVGMALYDSFGINMSGPNSERLSFSSSSDVIFSIPKLPLAAGDYRLTVIIFNENCEEEYDHFEEAANFTVLNDDSRQFGKINLFGKWKQV